MSLPLQRMPSEPMTSKKNLGGRPRKKPLPQQLQNLSYDELLLLANTPKIDLFLQPHQIPPPGNWRYHLFCGGRGAGKSFAGIYWLYGKIMKGAKKVAIVGPDFRSVENDLIPLLKDCYPPDPGKDNWYNSKNGVMHLPNDVVCYVYTSMGDIRGPNLEFVFCDEIVKWCDGIPEKQVERFDVLDMAVRIGSNPQIFIATTPKPNAFFRRAFKAYENNDPSWSISVASMKDNKFLSQSFINTIVGKFGHTRFGQQEIEGKVSFAMDGALWSAELIEKMRIQKLPTFYNNMVFDDPNTQFFYRKIVACDPAVTSTPDSDLSGLQVWGLGLDLHAYLLVDDSSRYTPIDFAEKVKELYDYWGCDCVVVETNNGKDYVTYTLKAAFGRQAPFIKDIHAKDNKLVRARPVVALCDQGRVHLVGNYPELEEQMIDYVGDPSQKSPDLIDAMVYGVTELMLENSYVQRDWTNLPRLG